jgi:hypothetical protein
MDGLRRLALQALDDFIGFGTDLGEYETVEVRTFAKSESKLVLGKTASVVDWMRTARKDNDHRDATYHLMFLKITGVRNNAIPMSRLAHSNADFIIT